ncbi:hypothetical protein VPPG_00029 [Vibrio phage VD1]|uniref:DNA-binding protein n=1 Tax=Vibrio diazotrophicus TaxID=685 RepID=A0ABX4W978_VIBDI|nr:hypothetical protein VPPG_00029 [Vibrio phage VD1]PNH99256.1 hypothetical protein C1O25_18050 [Vibrio diazotrophicus]
MASEKDLLAVMESNRIAWSPSRLRKTLGVDVCQLVRLIERARRAGAPIRCEYGEHTKFTNKYLLVEG